MNAPAGRYWVPPHVAAPETLPRRFAVQVLRCTRIWWLLTPHARGALCNCRLDRGERADSRRAAA